MFLRILILLIIFTKLNVYSLDNKERALVIAQKAIELMNKGEYQESIDSLNVCIDLDESNINFKYEKALAFTRLKRYQKAVDILTPLLAEKNINEKFYQLLGSSYDKLSAKKAATQVYKDGLEKFPNSGRLYQELGSNILCDTTIREAIDYWKKGIEVNPEYANNYFLIVTNTQTKDSLISIGSLLIAEEFVNIANSPKKVKEITQLLYNTYNMFFLMTPETFDKYKRKSELISSNEREFIDIFGGLLKNNFIGKRSINKSFSYDFNESRISILNEWITNQSNKKYNKKLINYFSKLEKSKNFEAYNFLMFNSQFPKEVNTWREKNKDKVNNFTEWLNKNIYSVFIKE